MKKWIFYYKFLMKGLRQTFKILSGFKKIYTIDNHLFSDKEEENRETEWHIPTS